MNDLPSPVSLLGYSLTITRFTVGQFFVCPSDPQVIREGGGHVAQTGVLPPPPVSLLDEGFVRRGFLTFCQL